jgi:hypothetical protein
MEEENIFLDPVEKKTVRQIMEMVRKNKLSENISDEDLLKFVLDRRPVELIILATGYLYY